MKSISKLKDEARKYEQREAWESAIQAYRQVLALGEEGEGELEIALYNRVGDLLVRLNRSREAVQYYEQAADRYADAGLFNNAIALCNKALRYMPDRAELLRKLGQFSSAQGFITDARRYFLEYADKQFAAGAIDPAVRALEELAQVADDAELRELVGHRLHAHGRVTEAVVHLKAAYEMRTGAGQVEQAQALRREITLIDPDALSAAKAPPGPSALDARAAIDTSGDLDVSLEPAPATPQAEPDFGAGFVIDSVDLGAGLVDDGSAGPDEPVAMLEGLESTTFEGFGSAAAEETTMAGLESDPLENEAEAAVEVQGLERPESLEASTLADTALADLERDQAFEPPVEGGEAGDGFELPLLPDTDDNEAGDPLPLLDENLEPEAADDAPLPLLDEADEAAAEAGWNSLSETLLAGADTEAEAAPLVEQEWAELPSIVEPEELTGPAFAARGEYAPQEPAAEMPVAPLDATSAEDEGDVAPAFTGEHGCTRVSAEDVAPPAAGDPEAAGAAAYDFGMEPARDPFEVRAPEPLDLPLLESSPEAPEHELPAAPREESGAREDRSASRPETEAIPGSESGSLEPIEAAPPAAPAPAPTEPPARPEYVDLAAMLKEPTPDEDTRFVVQEKAPTGDEDEDFAELLSQFKQKVAEHVSVEDAASHYDLGLAFKEMGLIDEAIGEFQVALRAGDMRLKVYEELGQCFLLKGQYNIAEKVLRRALESQFDDELELLGVYYHLGRACEELGNREGARDAYERVLGLDINFADVAARLARL